MIKKRNCQKNIKYVKKETKMRLKIVQTAQKISLIFLCYAD